jgi:hypothetical protein
MSKITSLCNAVIALDRRSFYRYLGITLGIFFCIIGLLVYSHYASTTYLRGRLKRVNQQRETIRTVLQENEEVIRSKDAVDAILAQEPNFKIKDIFERTLKTLNMPQLLNRGVEISENDLANGYTEIKLAASFSGMDMKQVCELLYNIKQNIRIYTKELKLIKDQKTNLLDVTLIIGTLEPRSKGM